MAVVAQSTRRHPVGRSMTLGFTAVLAYRCLFESHCFAPLCLDRCTSHDGA